MMYCKVHGKVEPLIGEEPDGTKHEMCPGCHRDWLLNKLNDEFYIAYHIVGGQKMAQALHTFLCKAVFLNYGSKAPYVALLQWSERYMNDIHAPEEFHPMVYGHLSGAWDKLKELMKWQTN